MQDKAARAYAAEILRSSARGTSSRELQAFENAYKANDVAALIRMTGSTTELGGRPRNALKPPWLSETATRPTVGAMAVMRLAALAHTNDDTLVKQILNNGGIQALGKLLGDVEQRDAAVLALNLLSAHASTTELAAALFGTNVIAPLIEVMKDGAAHPQLRATAAETCRNIFYCDEQYKLVFIRLGGLDCVRELVAVSDPEAAIEAVYLADDMLTSNTAEIRKTAAAALGEAIAVDPTAAADVKEAMIELNSKLLRLGRDEHHG